MQQSYSTKVNGKSLEGGGLSPPAGVKIEFIKGAFK
jgi:hypothetical protein